MYVKFLESSTIQKGLIFECLSRAKRFFTLFWQASHRFRCVIKPVHLLPRGTATVYFASFTLVYVGCKGFFAKSSCDVFSTEFFICFLRYLHEFIMDVFWQWVWFILGEDLINAFTGFLEEARALYYKSIKYIKK